jgi:hypothetical protein
MREGGGVTPGVHGSRRTIRVGLGATSEDLVNVIQITPNFELRAP